MRPTLLIGLLLATLGGYLLYRGGTFTTRRDVIEVGDVKVTAPEEHSIPRWAAGAVLVVGLGLALAGAPRRAGN